MIAHKGQEIDRRIRLEARGEDTVLAFIAVAASGRRASLADLDPRVRTVSGQEQGLGLFHRQLDDEDLAGIRELHFHCVADVHLRVDLRQRDLIRRLGLGRGIRVLPLRLLFAVCRGSPCFGFLCIGFTGQPRLIKHILRFRGGRRLLNDRFRCGRDGFVRARDHGENVRHLRHQHGHRQHCRAQALSQGRVLCVQLVVVPHGPSLLCILVCTLRESHQKCRMGRLHPFMPVYNITTLQLLQ